MSEYFAFPPDNQLTDAALRPLYKRLWLVHEAACILCAEADLDQVLNKILDVALETFPASYGVVLLVDTGGQLVPRAARQRSSGEIAMSDALLQRVVHTRRAQLEPGEDARHPEAVARQDMPVDRIAGASLAAPLLRLEGLLGALVLGGAPAESFSAEDLSICSTVANLIALAVQEARLGYALQRQSGRDGG